MVADLTAETFVTAITSFGSFDPGKGTARAWVFGIARHVYAAHCEACGQQQDRLQRLAGRRDLEPDQVEELLGRIDAERAGRDLVTGLGLLPDRDRAVGGSATPAYAVTKNPDGTITLAVYQKSGIAGINGRLRARSRNTAVVAATRAAAMAIRMIPLPYHNREQRTPYRSGGWRWRGLVRRGAGGDRHAGADGQRAGIAARPAMRWGTARVPGWSR